MDQEEVSWKWYEKLILLVGIGVFLFTILFIVFYDCDGFMFIEGSRGNLRRDCQHTINQNEVYGRNMTVTRPINYYLGEQK